MAGIEQRRETLLALGNYVGIMQADFLLGKGKKAPLTMTEAAEALNIAVSTVSRAVKGKYVQCPSGCVLFKSLFQTPAVRNQTVSTQGRDAIKSALKKLIDAEDKENPLSDTALAEKLCKLGIPISRRTIAKYRDSMGIRGCFDRREY